MKTLYKWRGNSIYRPRYFGYRVSRAVVKLIDSLIDIVVLPFGYESMIYENFCYWNLKKDAERFRGAKVSLINRQEVKNGNKKK